MSVSLYAVLIRPNWVDCCTTPIVALEITYTYHPVPLLSDFVPDSEDGNQKAEEAIQLSGHLVSLQPQKSRTTEPFAPTNFDPSPMEPDIIALELEVGPSTICVYGCLLAHLYQIKVLSYIFFIVSNCEFQLMSCRR
jgi:hypothetical protein